MIWHKAAQNPKPNKIILVKYSNVNFYGVYGTMPGTEIVPNCSKWCYLDELFACEQSLQVAMQALEEIEDAGNWVEAYKIANNAIKQIMDKQ